MYAWIEVAYDEQNDLEEPTAYTDSEYAADIMVLDIDEGMQVHRTRGYDLFSSAHIDR